MKGTILWDNLLFGLIVEVQGLRGIKLIKEDKWWVREIKGFKNTKNIIDFFLYIF